jgi:ArsR family transcriptional regulator, lead/cadmium/zinc/bismuth-responsive transcriptional repressor
MDTPQIETEAIDDATAQRLAEIFEALSDKTRLKIISVLAHHELVVGEVARLVGISESAVSHQLRLLRASRIVRFRKDGRQVFYTLDDQHVHDLFDRALAHIDHE